MELVINGENRTFSEDITINDIMTQLNIIDQVMAVAVNMQIVKKEAWEDYVPQDGDKIEMLSFVGGG